MKKSQLQKIEKDDVLKLEYVSNRTKKDQTRLIRVDDIENDRYQTTIDAFTGENNWLIEFYHTLDGVDCIFTRTAKGKHGRRIAKPGTVMVEHTGKKNAGETEYGRVMTDGGCKFETTVMIPLHTAIKSTDRRGRFTLGSEFGNKKLRIAVLEEIEE